MDAKEKIKKPSKKHFEGLKVDNPVRNSIGALFLTGEKKEGGIWAG